MLPLGSDGCCTRDRAARYRAYQATALVITFLAYVFLHAARKTFANVKPSLKADWADSMFGGSGDACEDFFGVLDATFMFAYAIGLLLLGTLGDRYDMRWVLLVGMCGPAAPIGAFALGSAAGVRSPAYYVCLWAANGLLQSLVWPSVVSVMGNWYGVGTRGLVMGLWSGNASAGNILGALLTTPVLAAAGWHACFGVVAALLVGGGLACAALLAPHPRDVGLPCVPTAAVTQWGSLAAAIAAADADAEGDTDAVGEDGMDGDDADAAADVALIDGRLVAQGGKVRRNDGEGGVADGSLSDDHSRALIGDTHDRALAGDGRDRRRGVSAMSSSKTTRRSERASPPHAAAAVTFMQAVMLPGVIVYSLCYAAVKSVNYTLFYWLPYYLTDGLGWANGDADSYSSLNDVGGIVGE